MTFDAKHWAVSMDRMIIKLKCAEHSECSICLNQMYNSAVYYMPCGHNIHVTCFKRLREQIYTLKCPLCRYPLTKNKPFEIRALTVWDILENLS